MPTGYGTAAGVSFAGLFGADALQHNYSRAVVSGSGIAVNTGGGALNLTSSDGITFDMPYFYATNLADSGTIQLHFAGSRGGGGVMTATEDLQANATARLLDVSMLAGLDSLTITPTNAASTAAGATLFGIDNAAVLSNPAPPPSPPPRCDCCLCVTSTRPSHMSHLPTLTQRRAPW